MLITYFFLLIHSPSLWHSKDIQYWEWTANELRGDRNLNFPQAYKCPQWFHIHFQLSSSRQNGDLRLFSHYKSQTFGSWKKLYLQFFPFLNGYSSQTGSWSLHPAIVEQIFILQNNSQVDHRHTHSDTHTLSSCQSNRKGFTLIFISFTHIWKTLFTWYFPWDTIHDLTWTQLTQQDVLQYCNLWVKMMSNGDIGIDKISHEEAF